MALPLPQPGDDLPPGDPGGGDGGSGGGGSGGGGTTPTPTPSPSVVGTVVKSGTYVKEDADSMLFVTIFAILQATDDLRCVGYMIVNNRVEQSLPINQIFDNKPSAAAGPMPFAFALDNLPAGPVALAFAVRNTDPNGPLTVRRRTIIRIEEIKTPAL